MTVVGEAKFDVDCPVHAHGSECGYQRYNVVRNLEGSILGLCDKCGYQIELAVQFGVKYRRMDDPSVLLSHDEFERSKPQ